ncbi:hypothetical protein EDB92DRAFT_1860541 [Lactarius akahatsu]|uniref:Uncharacterized protein n=1 Tax=Lactarius akahatsu TaxID=416441 RepID=A0AAD4LHT6_9AGAM|nr:hypothetical protein EDB92DRAFT_1860541 [Lactarius akahatsu]
MLVYSHIRSFLRRLENSLPFVFTLLRLLATDWHVVMACELPQNIITIAPLWLIAFPVQSRITHILTRTPP